MAWPAHVLVVANVTSASDDLLHALEERAERGPIKPTLLMPARGIGLAGREAERERLEAALAKWREAGFECDGVVGDSNPIDAVHETWDPSRFDEAIVCTMPGKSSRWLQYDFPRRVAHITGVHVTHVVARDMRPEPQHGPPPVHEREPLGPLSVLAWGGKH
jgi:hypothetical protein